MVFWEHKTDLVFLSITEETEVVINSIEDDVWESEYKRTVPLLTYLRVGNSYVCKYDQFLCPWIMLEKNENN